MPLVDLNERATFKLGKIAHIHSRGSYLLCILVWSGNQDLDVVMHLFQEVARIHIRNLSRGPASSYRRDRGKDCFKVNPSHIANAVSKRADVLM